MDKQSDDHYTGRSSMIVAIIACLALVFFFSCMVLQVVTGYSLQEILQIVSGL